MLVVNLLQNRAVLCTHVQDLERADRFTKTCHATMSDNILLEECTTHSNMY